MPPQIDVATKSCLEAAPEAVHVPGVDSGKNNEERVWLDVSIVGDRGVTKAQAERVLGASQESFTPLNVTLRMTEFRSVTLKGTDSQGIINQTKALFTRNERPAGSDMVWTLTTVDLTSPSTGNAVAGQADCIGGVRYPQSAFLVAEYTAENGFGIAPIWMYGNLDAKVASHETGHLLGAQHHYANCVEGAPTEVGVNRVEASPCTLMTNFADFISINFGTAEGLVVRAHAEEWARP
jgi:hypothetical protein